MKETQTGSSPSTKHPSPVHRTGEQRSDGGSLDQRRSSAHDAHAHDAHDVHAAHTVHKDHHTAPSPSPTGHSRNDSEHETSVKKPPSHAAIPPHSRIPDEDDEDAVAAQNEAVKAEATRHWRRILYLSVFLGITVITGIVWVEMSRYQARSTEALLAAKISAAIAAHTALHSRDGDSYEEIALVDWIRRCLGDSLSPSHDKVSLGASAEQTGQALVVAAERQCLRNKLVELATKQVIAEEVARQAGYGLAAAETSAQANQEIHFVIAFSRAHNYAIPDEFKVFKSDSNILKNHDEPADPETAAWDRLRH